MKLIAATLYYFSSIKNSFISFFVFWYTPIPISESMQRRPMLSLENARLSRFQTFYSQQANQQQVLMLTVKHQQHQQRQSIRAIIQHTSFLQTTLSHILSLILIRNIFHCRRINSNSFMLILLFIKKIFFFKFFPHLLSCNNLNILLDAML